MITEIIFILTLCTGTAWAIYSDRDGDSHPNNDWVIIGIIMLVSSVIVSMFDGRMGFLVNMLRSMSLAIGVYVLLFDYLIVLVLIARKKIELPRGKKWHNHFSDTAIPDKWDWWRWLPWYGRLFARLWFFSICAIVYFCPCKIVAYTNSCFICH